MKIPLEAKTINYYLEEEKDFLIGLVQLLETIEEDSLKEKKKEVINEFKEHLPGFIEKIFPSKNPNNQIYSLQKIARLFQKNFKELNLKDLGITSNWISLDKGFLGRIVEEDYEIAILLYLISAVYILRATTFVQTSPEYHYYHVSALAALYSALEFMEQLKSKVDNHYSIPFKKMLELRKLEVKAELTKAEAFKARKQGDFEGASKLFAGAASYRFSMMNFELDAETDNRMKILASTELGMACFYIAVGEQNKGNLTNAYLYLLKAKNYFENAAMLSEHNTELLEQANKRLDLVNPYIDRLKDSIEEIPSEAEQIPDPQPTMVHTEPEPLFTLKEQSEEAMLICSSCNEKISWSEKCSKCNKKIIGFD